MAQKKRSGTLNEEGRKNFKILYDYIIDHITMAKNLVAKDGICICPISIVYDAFRKVGFSTGDAKDFLQDCLDRCYENDLAEWCEEQKQNRDNLSEEQVKYLESIPGWTWDAAPASH